MLTLSGLWWTAYLSVWIGRRHAGCLVVACWCRGVEFLFFMQVSRLGLWSRIVLACCFILTMYLGVVDIFCYLGFGEYNCILLRFGDVLWFLSMFAAMLCNMIFMHVLYCGLFGDVASISRTCLMYSRVLPLIRNRVLQVGIRAVVGLVQTKTRWISCLYATCMRILSVLVVLFRCLRWVWA